MVTYHMALFHHGNKVHRSHSGWMFDSVIQGYNSDHGDAGYLSRDLLHPYQTHFLQEDPVTRQPEVTSETQYVGLTVVYEAHGRFSEIWPEIHNLVFIFSMALLYRYFFMFHFCKNVDLSSWLASCNIKDQDTKQKKVFRNWFSLMYLRLNLKNLASWLRRSAVVL